MALYILYRIGYLLVMLLPLKFSYGLACLGADICYAAHHKDREAIIKNLETILGLKDDRRAYERMARELYRNFAKYLVDFFRFSRLDEEYLKKFVKIEGAQNIDAALAKGKGVIAMSAHIGNWELGGSVIAMLGYPISAVVLTHRNKKIDEFFRRQRLIGKLMPIEIGAAIKECYRVLKPKGVMLIYSPCKYVKKQYLYPHQSLLARINPKGNRGCRFKSFAC